MACRMKNVSLIQNDKSSSSLIFNQYFNSLCKLVPNYLSYLMIKNIKFITQNNLWNLSRPNWKYEDGVTYYYILMSITKLKVAFIIQSVQKVPHWFNSF